MPIQIPQFQVLSPEQANPLGHGISQGVDIYNKIRNNAIARKLHELEAEKQRAEAPFWREKFLADLAKTQAEAPHLQAQTGLLNKQTEWYDKDTQSQIGARNSATGLDNEKIREARLKLKYPGLGQSGIVGQLAYLKMLQDNPLDNQIFNENIDANHGENYDNPINILKRNIKSDLSKKENGGFSATEDLTKSNITSNQSIIQSINNTVPLIEELKEFNSPNQLVGKYIHPNAQADYEGKVATITDSLVSALNLPRTNESISLVEKIVGKRQYESDKNYKKRLDSLIKDLNTRRSRSIDSLKGNGIILNKESSDSKISDPLGIR